MFGALLAAILFACSAVSGRRLAHLVSGTSANLIRLCIAAVFLGLFTHLLGSGFHRAALPILFISGCVGFGLGDLAMFQAFPRIGARRTMVLVQCLAAPFAALGEWAWLGTIPTVLQVCFGVIILLGVGIALMPGKQDTVPLHGIAAGAAFGIIAAICQAGGAVLSRKAYALAEAAGRPFTGAGGGVEAAYQRMLGGIFISLLFFLYLSFATKRTEGSKDNWRVAWPWLIGNSMAGPALGVTCYQWALMTAPTNIVLPIVATTPLLVMPLAHLLEKEPITRRGILGALISVGGVIGLTLSQ